MEKLTRKLAKISAFLLICVLVSLTTSCSHFARYPVNEPIKQVDQAGDNLTKNLSMTGNSNELLLILAFSGGGTRAASLSYGVLEELRDLEVVIEGTETRLLDEVDVISGVSGGSFTAAYFGLFGDRIFQDFETRFLKKNIQGALSSRTLFNPVNWVRLASPLFDRSDLAAEYYSKNVFDAATLGDLYENTGPMIAINATDMSSGARMTFSKNFFDLICSDVSEYPVARACAASSAVPGLLTPITLKNYGRTCGSKLPGNIEDSLEAGTFDYRQRMLMDDIRPLLDPEQKPYIHLVDGGVSDNLGLRTAIDSVSIMGDAWTTMKSQGMENVRKIAFVLVDAEKAVGSKWDKSPYIPPFSAIISSYTTIAIERYNVETIALLKESFDLWAKEIQGKRCPAGQIATEPGACGDIQFYLIEVRFGDIKNKEEKEYVMGLPTSFKLAPEEVDKLRDLGRRLLSQSEDFQEFLRDLEK